VLLVSAGLVVRAGPCVERACLVGLGAVASFAYTTRSRGHRVEPRWPLASAPTCPLSAPRRSARRNAVTLAWDCGGHHPKRRCPLLQCAFLRGLAFARHRHRGVCRASPGLAPPFRCEACSTLSTTSHHREAGIVIAIVVIAIGRARTSVRYRSFLEHSRGGAARASQSAISRSPATRSCARTASCERGAARESAVLGVTACLCSPTGARECIRVQRTLRPRRCVRVNDHTTPSTDAVGCTLRSRARTPL